MSSQVRSSLGLQVLLHCNKPYSCFLWVILMVLYFYKGAALPYPNHVRIMELLIILFFAPIEAVRLLWASRGNLTETPAFLAFSILLSFASMVVCVYLAVFQNYVLLIEEVFVCIQGVMIILETLMSFVLIATLSRPPASSTS